MTWATERLDALKAGTCELPPVTTRLGLGTLSDWGGGWVEKRWEPSPDLLNVDGSMFGGYTAALADQAAAFAAMTVLDGDSAYRTISLALQFFKLVRGEALNIRGAVVARSRSLIAVEVEFRTDDGALVAKATAQQVVTPFGSRSAAR